MRSLLFTTPAVAPAPVPLTPESNHSQNPPPVSTPTKPPRSLLAKSTIVDAARLLTAGPRVIVPVARSRVADFSGLL
jgi:hypothetical protein